MAVIKKNSSVVNNMAPVALECPIVGCDLGENGARYKTPELEAGIAIEMLKLHGQNHLQVQGGNNSASVSDRNIWERQKKSSAGMEMSESKWRDFWHERAAFQRSSFGRSRSGGRLLAMT